MKIQRYIIDADSLGPCAKPNLAGEWMLYADHEADHLSALQAQAQDKLPDCPLCGAACLESGPEAGNVVSCPNDPWCRMGNAVYPPDQWRKLCAEVAGEIVDARLNAKAQAQTAGEDAGKLVEEMEAVFFERCQPASGEIFSFMDDYFVRLKSALSTHPSTKAQPGGELLTKEQRTALHWGRNEALSLANKYFEQGRQVGLGQELDAIAQEFSNILTALSAHSTKGE